MTHRVGFIGNHTTAFDAAVGAQIVDVLKSYPEGTLFLTRGVAGFEHFVGAASVALGFRCFAYPGKGGRDNFGAWGDLIRDADEIVALLDPAALDTVARTGTGMFIDRALAAGKPVRACTIADGLLVWAEMP